MPVKDAEILKIIAALGEHYQRNINNRFVRQALVQMRIPQIVWERVERLTTKSGYSEANGYQYEELYDMILAAATLVAQARKDVVPNVRGLASRSSSRASSVEHGEAVLRDMAFSNLPANLGILADQINELYMKTIELDKRDHPKTKCVFERMPELQDLGRLLIAST